MVHRLASGLGVSLGDLFALVDVHLSENDAI
jgi:hypothetical protein